MGDSDYQGVQTRPCQVRLFWKVRYKQNKNLKRAICTNSVQQPSQSDLPWSTTRAFSIFTKRLVKLTTTAYLPQSWLSHLAFEEDRCWCSAIRAFTSTATATTTTTTRTNICSFHWLGNGLDKFGFYLGLLKEYFFWTFILVSKSSIFLLN